MSTLLKNVLITAACVTCVNAVAAIRSMRVWGQSARGKAEVFGYSLLGPFSGWVFHDFEHQVLAGTVSVLLIAPGLRWDRGWAMALAAVGLCLWFLPNAMVISTGV